MSNLKISVVIPYDGDKKDLKKSTDHIFVQNYPEELTEVVLINMTGTESEDLAQLERQHSESVMIINCEDRISRCEARNLGIEYCTGDYVLFLDCGDIFNVNLFEAMAGLASKDRPEIIGFKTTSAMQEFEHFVYNDFYIEDAVFYNFTSIRKKKRLLNSLDYGEDFHAYAYSREILVSSGQKFNEGESDADSTFVYPLLILSGSLLMIPEQGYCHFYKDGDEGFDAIASRINNNLKSQLKLYELFKSLPDLFKDYYDLIDAHFLRRYFIHTIDLFRSGGGDTLSVQQFLLMQLTCLKLVPLWIHNDYVYAFSHTEMEWLKALLKRFESQEQLESEFCKDAKISVIMTTYNRAYILDRGIRNILQQTWQNFEFIIINDNSSDDTEKVIQGFNDPRIKYIKNGENKGVSYARNLGLKKATGKYVVYQDDDDLARLDKLEKMMKCMSRVSENIAAVYHETLMYKETDKEGQLKLQIIPDREIDDVRKSGNIFPALLPINFITLPSIMFRKECLDKVGYFDEELVAYEDWELCLRLSREYEVAFIKEIMYDYFRGKGGLISNQESEHREKVLRSLYLVDLKYEQDRKSYNIGSNFKIVDD